MQKIIDAVSFPRNGDCFAVSFIEREIEKTDVWGRVVKMKLNDLSFRDSIFKCVDSDSTRVIGYAIHGSTSSIPRIFHRADWQMDNVNHLLPAIGITINEKEGENDTAKN